MKSAAVITLGCKTNQCEGALLRRGLAACGFRLVAEDRDADLVIVNTCTVTVRADRKCRQIVNKLVRERPDVAVYVTGCYATRAAEALAQLDGVVAVTADKRELLNRIARTKNVALPTAESELPVDPLPRSRAMLKIQDGCDAFCTYCIVPHIRPTLRSEPIDVIAERARRLVADGFREIVLTGIHVGRYGVDRNDGVRLVDVVKRVAATPGLDRLRLSSIEMFDVADDLIALIADDPVVCPHLHLPLQSGDDDVLAAMNRRYATGDVRQAIARILRRIPDVSITTDVIAGFPGETDQAFERTLALCREVGFSKIHAFPFSLRPGTAAEMLPGRLPAKVIASRQKRLLALADDLAVEYKQRFLGKTVEVLVESCDPDESGDLISRGLTGYYMRVCFVDGAAAVNRIVPVTVERVTPSVMEARVSD